MRKKIQNSLGRYILSEEKQVKVNVDNSNFKKSEYFVTIDWLKFKDKKSFLQIKHSLNQKKIYESHDCINSFYYFNNEIIIRLSWYSMCTVLRRWQVVRTVGSNP